MKIDEICGGKEDKASLRNFDMASGGQLQSHWFDRSELPYQELKMTVVIARMIPHLMLNQILDQMLLNYLLAVMMNSNIK